MHAAGRLQLDHATLAEILGISESAAASLVSGSYLLQPSRKREWEFALLLLRLFRSLDVTLEHGRFVLLQIEIRDGAHKIYRLVLTNALADTNVWP